MRVLISGAGVAGPVLAYFLKKAKIQVTIIEKATELLPVGQNIDIRASAIDVVRKMGLLDEVRRLNTTEKGTLFVKPDGSRGAFFPVTNSNSSLTAEFEILRGDLAMIFCNAAGDITLGTTIESVEEEKDGLAVKLDNGDTVNCDVLVAADGCWSRTRKQCFPPEWTTLRDFDCYAAYWTVPRKEVDNDYWNIYHALGSRVVSVRPDPHGTTRVSLTHMPSGSDIELWKKVSRGSREEQEALLRKQFGDIQWEVPRFLEDMSDTKDFYFQAIQQVKLKKWSSGRVVCLGDAASAPTPLTGMGTSLAIIGAYVLAGELSSTTDYKVAFDQYETKLRPYVEDIQDVPSFIPGIAHPSTPFKRWLLQTVAWAVSKIAFIFTFADKLGVGHAGKFVLPAYSVFDGDNGKNDAARN